MIKQILALAFFLSLVGCQSNSQQPLVQPEEKKHIWIKYKELEKACRESTSAQFTLLKRELKGKYVTWRGTIRNVDLSYDDTISLFIDMGTTSSYGFIDFSRVVYLYNQNYDDYVLGFRKGQLVEYTGKIELISNYDRIYGMQCNVHLSDWDILWSETEKK
ncbi:hypothetical protein SAMN05216361_0031 [Marisediminitalea aggregata]|uniref:Lipoprotein n=1 Tax=Marisediminitalea aggregata TaxID=634436 RepID=A0A1M5SMC4_9ALTE|nr:hypothetical protein [Marisediminitalea aggregata]SHH39674.1 hypothetical protein SAMN05216361_0031 [Marisediminitalea aggregata]